MTLHCIGVMRRDKIARIVVYASVKKRDAAALERSGSGYWKISVPDDASIAKLVNDCGAKAHTVSKPMRRSIAWIEQGVRACVDLKY